MFICSRHPRPIGAGKSDGFSGGKESISPLLIANLARMLLPQLEAMGIATTEEVQIETLEQPRRADLEKTGGIMSAPILIGAWARLPAQGRGFPPPGFPPPSPPLFGGRPPRRWPCEGPRGGPRRSFGPCLWRSGTRSIGRDCCICWRGPTA